jgi:splicing factor 3B subunit 3
MHLYSFTLQNGSFITHAVLGNFSGSKQQEIVISRGNILELYRPDMNTYKVQPIHSIKVFGVIRSLITFRLTGGSKDYVIVGSDSGRIVILEYNSEKNAFDKLHEETFGKSGCRRIVPGQFLTVDPKGRAVMIAALEKQKLVYILNRDSSARLTISSPLEAHKSKTLVYDIAALDNGYENPLFACLELDYSEIDEDPTGTHLAEVKQCVVLYELDLGLNHVVRKQSEELENLCYKIISVPAGKDTPGGMLLCSENYITYKNIGEQEDVRIPIPRRKSCTRESVMIVAAATHKTKSLTFFLLQTEQGDVFKLTLDCSAEDEIITVVGLRIKYIDTLLPAVSMCILKAGFLFVTSEFGDQSLFFLLR